MYCKRVARGDGHLLLAEWNDVPWGNRSFLSPPYIDLSSKGNVMAHLTSSKYVPVLPTLAPRSLASSPHKGNVWAPNWEKARFFYFTRNAIFHAAKAVGLEGKEVLMPAYHHGVEVEAMVAAGAIPRFYRVDEQCQVDVESIRRMIGSKTKLLYLIHYAGFPGPARELRDLADLHGLSLWEDCALSFLSFDGDVPLGNWGDVTFFCLYKTLPLPNGGGLLSRKDLFPEGLALQKAPPFSAARQVAHSLLQHAQLRLQINTRKIRRAARFLGKKFLPTHVPTGTQHFQAHQANLAASSISLRLANAFAWEEIRTKRRRNYLYLQEHLGEDAPIFGPSLPSGVCPLFYPLWVDDKEAVLQNLATFGVESVDFWRHFHPACDESEFPEVARLRRSVLEIPCHQDLGPQEMKHVVVAVRAAMKFQRMRRNFPTRGLHATSESAKLERNAVGVDSRH